jgi:hypothetical protein
MGNNSFWAAVILMPLFLEWVRFVGKLTKIGGYFMKRTSNRLITASIIIAAVFCVSLFSFAEDGKKDKHESDRMGKMKKFLSLSDDQVLKIKDVYSNSMIAIEPLKKQLGSDVKALKQSFKAGVSNDVLQPLLDTIQADHKKLMDAVNDEKDQIKAILTPSQIAKEIIAMSDRMEKEKKSMKNEEEEGEDNY